MNAALSDNTNGQTLNNDSLDAAPDTDSTSTPVSHVTASASKIDIDGAAAESDARHEPAPMKVEQPDDASTRPQNGDPQAPGSIPIDPPKGTPPPPTGELLEDVKMAEQAEPNGVAKEEEKVDIEMDGDMPAPAPNGDAVHSPISIPTGSSTTAVASNSVHTPDDRDEDEPPAKRPRKFSDADQASLAHSATPPPASATSSVANGATSTQHQGPSTLSLQQHRFCVSTVRTLKKLKDAAPFLKPVDIVALNIPHYPSIIKHPMDFETISNKLTASNPAKLDPNSTTRYHTADEFITDVRSIFRNCETFNGPDHVITAMGKRVEAVFDKQIKQMPPPDEPKPPVVKKASPIPPPPPPASAKKPPARRPSASVPAIRRSEESLNGRPKREIHPPPPRDLPYVDGPKRPRKAKVPRDDGSAEQLKFCSKILTELHRKQHYNIASPFYEPVDWVKLDIPTYPKMIKKPMDMSTIRKKLDNHEYRNAGKFYEDFKLMTRNCYTFNPVGTPVNQAGVELDKLFDEKWKGLPPLREFSDLEDEEDDETDDERARAIAEMESQIETMKANLAGLKAKPSKEIKKKEKKREKPTPVASSSKAASKPTKQGSSSKKKSKKATLPDDDVLSFEQKKDLSETIQRLDGTKLEKVIQIIHEGVPEIRDSTEEIELEIDLLPAAVLTKLYNFVLRPLQRHAAPKRSRTGKGTGTGGLKRKSMDEDVETEKIRQLEERMRLFEQGGAANLGSSGTRADMSEHSSDSSDGSDSSGSDSE